MLVCAGTLRKPLRRSVIGHTDGGASFPVCVECEFIITCLEIVPVTPHLMLVPSLACRAVVLYKGTSQTRRNDHLFTCFKRAFTFRQIRYDALIDTFANEVLPPRREKRKCFYVASSMIHFKRSKLLRSPHRQILARGSQRRFSRAILLPFCARAFPGSISRASL